MSEQEQAPQVPQGSMMSPFELVVHHGGIVVDKIQTTEGRMVLVKFVTPFMTITVTMDEEGVDALVRNLTSGIVIPKPGVQM